MHDNLVIVESPAKAKTLEKFLGDGFIVKSSYGHIRDLVKKDLGIDIEGNFTPSYEVAADKKKVVAELSKAAKKAKTVWLASDEDREGEAIAWHLTQVLDLPVESTKRIVFHEITKGAILSAIENPRTLDMNLVNAQQARRILDRLVGFELSPLLWRKVKPSLSAGRVQSVTVRLLVEREREIIAFQTVPFYRVTAEFFNINDPKKIAFKAELNKRFETEEQAKEFLNKCIGAEFTVSASASKPGSRNPSAPFTTSTLQQEAGRKLNLSVAQTMSVAQKLYENGWITYMRTDSLNLSKQAIAASKEEIVKLFGEKYHKVRVYKTKTKGAQEAHEAIRPSYFNRPTIEGTPIEKKLYDLIWKRTVASQMAPAEIEKTVVTININSAAEHFTATGEVVLFDGFMKLYSESSDDDTTQESTEGMLPAMKQGDKLAEQSITAMQRFTQSPSRYSEASLVKRLEELGIGRPSTYAPTISTVIARGYVLKQSREGVKRDYTVMTLEGGKIAHKIATENVGKEHNRLSPTDIGMVVTDYLEDQFKSIMDYNFTANVEEKFDEIAAGDKEWIDMIREFYTPFHAAVEVAMETVPENINTPRILGNHPKTGLQISARIGKFGPVVQMEPLNEEDKPRFASLREGQLIPSLTLEEALELFSLPRTLGHIDDKEVVVNIGRFGPYVRFDGKFTSLDKSDDPYTIELERAITLIEEKKKRDTAAKTPLVVFEEEPQMLVLKGRYGPYISFEGKNYPVPKAQNPEELTLEEARKIIEKKKKPAK